MADVQGALDRFKDAMFPPPAFDRDGVQSVGVADIIGAREFPALIEEYAAESALEYLPTPRAKLESYTALELSGALYSFAAIKAGAMVGFITVLAPRLLHFDATIAVAESWFVTAEHRKGGAGLRLLAAAEEQAAKVGSPVLVVCAPCKGRLFEILTRRGYVETNRVFAKVLKP